MYFGNNRKQIFILSITAIILVFAAILFFLNAVHNNTDPGFAPYGLLLFFFLVQVLVVKIAIDTTDENKLQNYISTKITNEKITFEQQLKEDENEKGDTDIAQQQELKIEEILPAGAFKKAESYCKKLLTNLSNHTEAIQGIMYTLDRTETFNPIATFAIEPDIAIAPFKPGENINGQVAKEQKLRIIDEIPDDYTPVESGLGKAKIKTLVVLPLINNNSTIAIIELGYFNKISNNNLELLKNACPIAGKKINDLITS